MVMICPAKMNSFTKVRLLHIYAIIFVEFCNKKKISSKSFVPFPNTPLISKEHDGDDVNKGTG